LSFWADTLDKNEEISIRNEQLKNSNIDDTDYGLIVEKPIYCSGISGSEKYLARLRTEMGHMLKWERKGSTSANNIEGMIDIYEGMLPSGRFYKTIYINMYSNSNSNKAPKGFMIVET
jgi:hypothetical protein